MLPIDYNTKQVDMVILLGTDGTKYKGEYLDMRIDRKTVPDGKYAYDCRHDDNGDWVSPVTIEKYVMVNFAGTFITDTPICFPDGLSYIELKGWEYL